MDGPLPFQGFLFRSRFQEHEREQRNESAFLQTVGGLDCQGQPAAELLEEPAMYRVRYGRKSWRTRWPWKRMFPLKVDERSCRTCGLAYQNGPQPREKMSFTSGNVAALIFPAGNWNRRQTVVKFGRWKARSGAFFLSEYFSAEDLEDLVQVVAQAHEYFDDNHRKVRRR